MKEKTVGQLIDELITTSMKLWVCQDILNASEDRDVVFKTTKMAMGLNKKRTDLIQDINECLGGVAEIVEKVYRE